MYSASKNTHIWIYGLRDWQRQLSARTRYSYFKYDRFCVYGLEKDATESSSEWECNFPFVFLNKAGERRHHRKLALTRCSNNRGKLPYLHVEQKYSATYWAYFLRWQ